jgi:hypothetical protein
MIAGSATAAVALKATAAALPRIFFIKLIRVSHK